MQSLHHTDINVLRPEGNCCGTGRRKTTTDTEITTGNARHPSAASKIAAFKTFKLHQTTFPTTSLNLYAPGLFYDAKGPATHLYVNH